MTQKSPVHEEPPLSQQSGGENCSPGLPDLSEEDASDSASPGIVAATQNQLAVHPSNDTAITITGKTIEIDVVVYKFANLL